MAVFSSGGLRPELHQLEIFLKVVEARTFAGAARMMGRTQPAISQAIARLEEIYGGDLFERRRGALLELTPIGEAILPSARTILDTIDQQMLRAAAAAQSRAGNLTLGFMPGLIAGPLRAGIADFTAASPQVRLRLVEALPGETYLRERGITGARNCTALRYHPRCWYRSDDDDPADHVRDSWPALIVAVTDNIGFITGAHRTWLDPSGTAKAPVSTPRRAMGLLLGKPP
jgi:DNA-binding MarR family transcriptional regulator